MVDPSTSPGGDIATLAQACGLEQQGFWQQVVDTIHEGLLIVGPDRSIVYLNRRAEELVGRRLEDVRGQPCVEALNCPQCRCCCRLFEHGGADRVEVTVFNPVDDSRRVLLKNARLFRDASGRVLGGVETFTDITREVEQRRENEQFTAILFQEKTRVDALLDAMDEGVLAIDVDQRVIMLAPRTAELLGGLDPAAARGRPLADVLGVDPTFFGVARATELDGRTFRLELHPAGRAVDASLTFRRVRQGDDEMLGLLRIRDEPGPRPCGQEQSFHGIISRAPRMREIFRLIESGAQTHAGILIEGESGVGKELVARAIHELSPRREQPFYAVNCATFTGSILLSELFGHERGAFTDAVRTTPGKLELAGAGTLFLDEVSEIPLPYQAVLLRVLEERRFERVGGRQPITLRARIIAATNVQLAEAVRARRFRDDLYFRLKVVPITVPPLRERREDVPLLARYFANHPAINLTGRCVRFTDAALQALAAYAWPGNVRELRNLVEYLIFVGGELIDVEHLPAELQTAAAAAPAAAAATPRPGAAPGTVSGCAPAWPGTSAERAAVLEALEQTRYRRADAARLLGIDRSTLWRRMRRLGIA